MKPPKKFTKMRGLRRKLPKFERPEDTIKRFNHKPFNPATLYGDSEVKPGKTHEWESLVPTGKVPFGSKQTSTVEYIYY